MIGILIILVISWALLYLAERKSLLVLGIVPNRKRLQQLGIGFLLTSLLCLSVQFLEINLKSTKWLLNKKIEVNLILRMLFWDLKSVITEELIFRGALIYILIQKLSKLKGIIISSIAFGIYHWFTFEILGSIIPMIVVFIGTGLMGYAFALSFSKTKSIAMPIGLHLGWNFTVNTIFSNGPLGNGIILSESNNISSD
jgi:membrane protease YdiL (CAAX protease family)